MPALRTALRLILREDAAPPSRSRRFSRLGRAGAKGRARWITGSVAVLSVAAVAVVGAPGTAHAHTRVGAPTTTVAAPPIPVTTAPAPPPTIGAPAIPPPAIPAPGVPAPAVPAPAVPAPAVPAAYSVVQSVVILTDSSRSTPARGEVAESTTRVLRTLILSPASATGRLPVVVFAAGYDSEPESYLTLLHDWAAAGYVVLAPESPGSARDLPGAPVRSDIAGQAQDLSFVVTAVMGGLAGPVDTARITVAGHSDGGSAVAILALDPVYRDTRISSYIVLSGAIPDGVAGSWGAPNTGRLLVVVGDDDEYGNLPASTGVFETAAMTKTLVVALGGDHLGTYLGSTQLAAAVRAETLSFLAGRALDGESMVAVDTSSLSVTQAA